MVTPEIETVALQVLLTLPSGTDVSDVELQRAVRQRLPERCSDEDMAKIRGLASSLTRQGYLLVARDEPGLYRIP